MQQPQTELRAPPSPLGRHRQPDPTPQPQPDQILVRLAQLEARMNEKDKQIGELQAMVRQLSAAAPPTPPAGAGAGPPSRRPPSRHTPRSTPPTSSARNKPVSPVSAPGSGGSRRGGARGARRSADSPATPGTGAGSDPTGNFFRHSRAFEQRVDVDTATDGIVARPMRGRVYPPTGAPPADPSPPEMGLELDFVYGYRGKDCRDNLKWNAQGELVYFIAATGIVYNPQTHTQRHFLAHTDDISAMALHPDGVRVATGQVDPKGSRTAYILIWSSETLEQLAALEGFHQRGLACLSFDPSGDLLAAVGQDNQRTLAVWQWSTPRVMVSATTHQDQVFAMAFNPALADQFVVVGLKLCKFFSLERSAAGLALSARNGVMGNKGKQQGFPCMAFTPQGQLLLGCMSGEVYVFRNREVSFTFQAHDGPVYGMQMTPAGLVTCGKDGRVTAWSSSYQAQQTVDLSAVAGMTVRARTLDSPDGASLAVGTLGNEIFHVDMRAGAAQKLISGNAGELWGLCAHATTQVFATASYDQMLRVFDTQTRQAVLCVPLPAKAQSLDFSPDCAHLAVGLVNGGFVIVEAASGSIVLERSDRYESLRAIRYSPDGSQLAVGSSDNFIDLYHVAAGYRRRKQLRGHSSFITHLDFSVEGNYLRSVSGDYELMHWDVASGDKIGYASQLRDVAWATNTCIFGYHAVGIWPPESDGTDVNACTTTRSLQVVATGDDFGLVKLFRYPAAQPRSRWLEYKGHSSHVTNVAFSCDDSLLLSAGGNDMAIFQWRVASSAEALEDSLI